jgi:peptidoglycan/xylan/chitin deacetylase (PgdA/CDA1 family)
MKNKIKLLVFLVARTLGLFALCRWLTRDKVRILCYHGGCLGDEHRYNPKLFCSARMLAQRMQWLQRKRFHVVPLDEATRIAGATGKRPALTTAITFDDGWYSTASELIPVLGKLAIPSTLYLCTSHYLEGWAIPSVAVRYLIWKSGLQSVVLQGFGAATDGACDLSTPALRNQAANRIVAAIDAAPPNREHKHALLTQLAACLGVSAQQLDLASRRFEYMNRDELLALPAQGCSIELHGHVHSYPAGNPAAFADDLRQCSATIEQAGLPRPAHYCYPSGNFDAAASATMVQLDVRSATTCLPGLIGHADPTQLHYLPRFLDGESITMLEFEAEMSGFSALIRRLAGH